MSPFFKGGFKRNSLLKDKLLSPDERSGKREEILLSLPPGKIATIP
jgi:hypothetical protein